MGTLNTVKVQHFAQFIHAGEVVDFEIALGVGDENKSAGAFYSGEYKVIFGVGGEYEVGVPNHIVFGVCVGKEFLFFNKILVLDAILDVGDSLNINSFLGTVAFQQDLALFAGVGIAFNREQCAEGVAVVALPVVISGKDLLQFGIFFF